MPCIRITLDIGRVNVKNGRMITRIYRYKIREGCEDKYLCLQERVLALYRRLAEVDVLFLRDEKVSTRRTEVIRFLGIDPAEDIRRIDADPAIMQLFAKFKAEILDPQNPQIEEENCVCEGLSAAGKLHHVEIYCSDLKKTAEFWGWFLAEPGALFIIGLIAAGGLFCSVEARVRQVVSADDIESIRFLSPNNMPLKVLVVYTPGQQNANFVISLINIVAQMHEKGMVKQEDAFKVHVIPGWEMQEKDYAHINEKVGAERVKRYVEFNRAFKTRDMWMQDWGEVGVVTVKGERKPQTVVFDSNRGRDNAELPGILANFWSSYLVKNPSQQNSGGDYGGNIEVTPDNILLIGNTSTPELRAYLEKHGYKNRMAVLETDWLHVGHVDEYISVCPNPKALRGYTLIKANPRLALRLVKDAPDAELKEIPQKEYRDAMLAVKKYLIEAEKQRAEALKLDAPARRRRTRSFGEAVLEYLESSEAMLAASESGAGLAWGHEIARSDVEKFIQLNLTLGNLIDTNVKKACDKISEVRNDAGKPHLKGIYAKIAALQRRFFFCHAVVIVLKK